MRNNPQRLAETLSPHRKTDIKEVLDLKIALPGMNKSSPHKEAVVFWPRAMVKDVFRLMFRRPSMTTENNLTQEIT